MATCILQSLCITVSLSIHMVFRVSPSLNPWLEPALILFSISFELEPDPLGVELRATARAMNSEYTCLHIYVRLSVEHTLSIYIYIPWLDPARLISSFITGTDLGQIACDGAGCK